MAPCEGVDYLDRNMKEYLGIPRKGFFDNENVSVIGLMFELFSKTGTSTWVRFSTEQCREFAKQLQSIGRRWNGFSCISLQKLRRHQITFDKAATRRRSLEPTKG